MASATLCRQLVTGSTGAPERHRFAAPHVVSHSDPRSVPCNSSRCPFRNAERVPITVYSANDAPFAADTTAPELPGRTCYPPLAALITSAARLMLALLEREVTDRGGSYAFCDTDSMAIVVNEHGGLVPCLGG